MIALPITMAILVLGVIFVQYNHYQFVDRRAMLNKTVIGAGQLEEFRKDFEEYKKRVDALTLKAGFKL
jgi:hypothetical protein